MPLEQDLSIAFQSVLSGKQINIEIGAWRISNLNEPYLVDMMRGSGAVYGFDVKSNGDIIFDNYHREARTGTGTESLKELEEGMRTLANETHKQVTLLFNTFGQEKTRSWLMKNGYTMREDRVYEKNLFLINSFSTVIN